MTLAYKLVGNAMQMAVCQLADGQSVYCEAGKFVWKTTNVSVETRLTHPMDAVGVGGFLLKAVDAGKRVIAGESLTFQYYTAHEGAGLVSFAGGLPGELRALELDNGRSWYAEKDAFVAAEESVNFDIAFSGSRERVKGGDGFVLEKFTGSGTVLIAGAGNLIELNPAKYGGQIQVDPGRVVAFEDTVAYGVKQVAQLNVKTAVTAILGGEGLSLATLEGDGLVILQSTTIDGLAKALAKNISAREDKRGPLGGLLSGSMG